jgi:hypothetical protein
MPTTRNLPRNPVSPPCHTGDFSLLFYLGRRTSNHLRHNDFQRSPDSCLPAFRQNHPAPVLIFGLGEHFGEHEDLRT